MLVFKKCDVENVCVEMTFFSSLRVKSKQEKKKTNGPSLDIYGYG